MMPWLGRVKAIVEAWYPGQAGGQAIAEVLTVTITADPRLLARFDGQANRWRIAAARTGSRSENPQPIWC
jgi:beta-glucosidase